MRPNILEALFRSNNAADNGLVIILIALFCAHNAADNGLVIILMALFCTNNAASIIRAHYPGQYSYGIMTPGISRAPQYSGSIIPIE